MISQIVCLIEGFLGGFFLGVQRKISNMANDIADSYERNKRVK
jgi:hypothetical protein